MTFASERLAGATMSSAALTTTVGEARPLIVPSRLWHATVVVGDVLGMIAIVLCIPVVILGIGLPIALCLRLLLWLVGMPLD